MEFVDPQKQPKKASEHHHWEPLHPDFESDEIIPGYGTDYGKDFPGLKNFSLLDLPTSEPSRAEVEAQERLARSTPKDSEHQHQKDKPAPKLPLQKKGLLASADLAQPIPFPEPTDAQSPQSQALFPFSTLPGAIAAPDLLAQTMPFPRVRLPSVALPALEVLPEALRAIAPLLKGGGLLLGPILEGVFAAPAGPDEAPFLRHPSPSTSGSAPHGQHPAQPTVPPAPVPTATAPAPTSPAQRVLAPTPSVMPRQSSPQQHPPLQLQQLEQAQKQHEQAFKAQQAAQAQFWALQERLSTFSSGSLPGEGFGLNEGIVADYAKQLPLQQQAALQQTVNSRYHKVEGLAAQAQNPISPEEQATLHQQIQQQALYERYVPVREIYHFGQQFLNGITPQRMRAVRGYFDQVFEGQYSKSIPEKQRGAIIQIADAKYTQETGRQANREDPLWKTYRNVEASRKYPDLWHQFRDDISVSEGMSVHPTMTNANDPDLGSQALGRPDRTPPLEVPDHTGHASQERFDPNAINQRGNDPKLNLPSHTGHEKLENVPVKHVFESNERQKAEKEQAIDDYLRGLGSIVEPNPLEGMKDAGRQGDRYINGLLTEYKTLEPGATSNSIKQRVNDSLRGISQARYIIIDARNTEMSEDEALKGIYRAIGVSRGKLDSLRVIGNGFDIEEQVQQKGEQ
jgi:Contact-dependent growth inhibition CdiA C-terminal domain